MAKIPTYMEWIGNTNVQGRERGRLLLELDKAVKQRNPTLIRMSLDAWCLEKSAKGQNWLENERNRTKAFTKLYRAVNDEPPKNLSTVDRQKMARAWDEMVAEKQRRLVLRFRNTELVLKSEMVKAQAKANKSRARTVKAGLSALLGIKDKVKDVKDKAATVADLGTAVSGGDSGPIGQIKAKILEAISGICGDFDPQQILSEIGLPGLAEFLAEAAPILGAVKDGLKTANAWAKVAGTVSLKQKTLKQKGNIAEGGPEMALRAIAVLLDRERNAEIAAATAVSATFALKSATAAADLGVVTGPVVAAAQMVAEVIQKIHGYVRDKREVEAANQLLRVGALNLEIFEVCPILGCYFLAMEDHSTILALASEEFGASNWEFDVKGALEALDPLVMRAREMIKTSRFELVGVGIDDTAADRKLTSLQGAKGLVEEGYAAKRGLAKAQAFPAYVKETLTERIWSAIGMGEVSTIPVVPAGRIQGQGPRKP
jgi:hypothetical protein